MYYGTFIIQYIHKETDYNTSCYLWRRTICFVLSSPYVCQWLLSYGSPLYLWSNSRIGGYHLGNSKPLSEEIVVSSQLLVISHWQLTTKIQFSKNEGKFSKKIDKSIICIDNQYFMFLWNKFQFSKNEKNSPKTEKLLMKYEYSSHFTIKGVSSSLKWVVSSTGNGHELQKKHQQGGKEIR